MNDEHKQIWLDALQFALSSTGGIMGQKPETIAKRAASIADAALFLFRERFEVQPATVLGAPTPAANDDEGE